MQRSKVKHMITHRPSQTKLDIYKWYIATKGAIMAAMLLSRGVSSNKLFWSNERTSEIESLDWNWSAHYGQHMPYVVKNLKMTLELIILTYKENGKNRWRKNCLNYVLSLEMFWLIYLVSYFLKAVTYISILKSHAIWRGQINK